MCFLVLHGFSDPFLCLCDLSAELRSKPLWSLLIVVSVRTVPVRLSPYSVSSSLADEAKTRRRGEVCLASVQKPSSLCRLAALRETFSVYR